MIEEFQNASEDFINGTLGTKEARYEDIINWMKSYKEKTNCKGVVLGLSGGKDSTVVAMLSKIVYDDNVIAILMPNGEQKDISDSLLIANTLKLNYKIVNIETIYNSLIHVVENKIVETEHGRDFAENCGPISDKAKTNIPPRIRMTVLYAVAQSHGYRVIGTGNKSESFLGWFTKGGDSLSDFNPLAELTCTQVREIGRLAAKELGFDEEFCKSFIDKKPADGLTGKSDEDNFGFTYEELDKYIETGHVSEHSKEIQKMHDMTSHKRRMPYTVKDKLF